MHAYMYTLYKSDTSRPALEKFMQNWISELVSFYRKQKFRDKRKNTKKFRYVSNMISVTIP